MDKSDIHTLAGSQAKSLKAHIRAWDKEYCHLRWGGPAPIKNLQVHLLPGSKVLDAGSGNGRYLTELTKYYLTFGVDISVTALSNSRTQLKRNGRFAEHIRSSIHKLPFKSHSFDGILCYGVLQHIFPDEREAAVMEFRRVLREGGLVFFEAFGSEDMRCGENSSIPYEKNTFIRQNGLIYHYFTKEEVNTLFQEFETTELDNLIKEKTFRGEAYKRHMIKGIFRKF